jgi:hypothetical protein
MAELHTDPVITPHVIPSSPLLHRPLEVYEDSRWRDSTHHTGDESRTEPAGGEDKTQTQSTLFISQLTRKTFF